MWLASVIGGAAPPGNKAIVALNPETVLFKQGQIGRIAKRSRP
jgi:hypothetical protein